MDRGIKVACLQYQAVPKAYEKNKETVVKLLEDLSSEKPDIILLPELSFNGHYYSRDKNDLCESIDGKTFEFMQQYSKKLDITLVAGINEKIEGSNLCYSTTLLVDQGKLIGYYRKQNPPGIERVFVKPGEKSNNTFITKYGKIMLLTCYDMSYAETYVSAYDSRPDLVLVSNAWLKMEKMPFVYVEKYEHHVLLPRAIAMQLRCPVAVANLVGPTRFLIPGFPMFGDRIMDFETEFYGNSLICDYMGTVITTMDDYSTGSICATVNTQQGNEMRKINFDNYGVQLLQNYVHQIDS